MYWRINSVMRFKLSAVITTSALISTASPVSIKNRNACCETESGASCFREGGSNGLAASVVRSFAAAALKRWRQRSPMCHSANSVSNLDEFTPA